MPFDALVCVCYLCHHIINRFRFLLSSFVDFRLILHGDIVQWLDSATFGQENPSKLITRMAAIILDQTEFRR